MWKKGGVLVERNTFLGNQVTATNTRGIDIVKRGGTWQQGGAWIGKFASRTIEEVSFAGSMCYV